MSSLFFEGCVEIFEFESFVLFSIPCIHAGQRRKGRGGDCEDWKTTRTEIDEILGMLFYFFGLGFYFAGFDQTLFVRLTKKKTQKKKKLSQED